MALPSVLAFLLTDEENFFRSRFTLLSLACLRLGKSVSLHITNSLSLD